MKVDDNQKNANLNENLANQQKERKIKNKEKQRSKTLKNNQIENKQENFLFKITEENFYDVDDNLNTVPNEVVEVKKEKDSDPCSINNKTTGDVTSDNNKDCISQEIVYSEFKIDNETEEVESIKSKTELNKLSLNKENDYNFIIENENKILEVLKSIKNLNLQKSINNTHNIDINIPVNDAEVEKVESEIFQDNIIILSINEIKNEKVENEEKEKIILYKKLNLFTCDCIIKNTEDKIKTFDSLYEIEKKILNKIKDNIYDLTTEKSTIYNHCISMYKDDMTTISYFIDYCIKKIWGTILIEIKEIKEIKENIYNISFLEIIAKLNNCTITTEELEKFFDLISNGSEKIKEELTKLYFYISLKNIVYKPNRKDYFIKIIEKVIEQLEIYIKKNGSEDKNKNYNDLIIAVYNERLKIKKIPNELMEVEFYAEEFQKKLLLKLKNKIDFLKDLLPYLPESSKKINLYEICYEICLENEEDIKNKKIDFKDFDKYRESIKKNAKDLFKLLDSLKLEEYIVEMIKIEYETNNEFLRRITKIDENNKTLKDDQEKIKKILDKIDCTNQKKEYYDSLKELKKKLQKDNLLIGLTYKNKKLKEKEIEELSCKIDQILQIDEIFVKLNNFISLDNSINGKGEIKKINKFNEDLKIKSINNNHVSIFYK